MKSGNVTLLPLSGPLQSAFVRTIVIGTIVIGMSHRMLPLAVLFAALAFAQEPAPATRAKRFLDLLAQGNFAAAQSMLNAELAPSCRRKHLEQVWKCVVVEDIASWVKEH
jgi:hypothetical protein